MSLWLPCELHGKAANTVSIGVSVTVAVRLLLHSHGASLA